MTSSLLRIADRRLLASVVGACAAVGLLPLITVAILSFSSVDAANVITFGSLDGYRAILAGGRVDEFVRIVNRSMVVSMIALFIAIPAAYWLAGLDSKRQTLVLALTVTPWLVSDMLRAFGWQQLLSPVGPISSGWELLTNLGPIENLRYNTGAVILGLVSALVPASLLSVFAAIPDRSRNEWLAASELGSPIHVFRLMMLGRAMPGIALAIVAVFILSCFSSAEPRFLDGPTQTSIQTIAASLVNDGIPALLAFATFLVAFVGGISLTGAVSYILLARQEGVKPHLQRLQRPVVLKNACPASSIVKRLADLLVPPCDAIVRHGPPMAGIGAILLCWAPLVTVGIEAFRQPGPNGGRWTLENFQLMLSSEQLQTALGNSLGVATAVSAITVILAFILSLVVWNRALRPWILLMLALLVFLPGDAYAIGLIQLLKVLGYNEGGSVPVIVAHALWALPFAAGTLMLANHHVSEHVIEASLEYGNGPLAVIFCVIGRINLGRLVGVSLLAGALSVNEYIRSAYLGGGLVTISNEVHGRLTAGLLPQNRGVFAAEFIVIAISIAIVFVVFGVLGVRGTSAKQ